ncbi:MAG: DUF308 domain-containing protein [Methanocorpusculum sp.]|uniref:DUF308 domain-containing protein n=1 Tax=Methanocorpusculum petauri TaxID=3002863 RepID=A0ABT4IH20_9EURY|nr:DUF308 domain-containing protein [Methanocorpusculum petauri]MDE2444514.1 DUF308 domain-containing protein [Methanocorpusculum sp.]MCZ0860851.1 DUF308 domain-containing protein [Methanocorpusculum petauri]MDE2518651.1 DUF308 domain-containing protein [Methanocorpusculum sp.]MDE2523191.1 DUF308 domain-containing protein [Methanocorpusculum sp.]MDE2525055.1 DUF308 domain-containing protein [Methanocorpusculum sp.]
MNNIVILEQTLLPDAWKPLLLKGIVLLVLGIFCLAFPFAALNVGAYLIAVLLLFVSIAALFSGFAAFGEPKATWWMILLGIIGIIIALASFIHPEGMIWIATVFIGIVALLSGVTDVISAFSRGLSAGQRILMLILGIIGIIIGLFFLLFPEEGAPVLTLVLGILLAIAGIVSLIQGYVYKKEFATLVE